MQLPVRMIARVLKSIFTRHVCVFKMSNAMDPRGTNEPTNEWWVEAALIYFCIPNKYYY